MDLISKPIPGQILSDFIDEQVSPIAESLGWRGSLFAARVIFRSAINEACARTSGIDRVAIESRAASADLELRRIGTRIAEGFGESAEECALGVGRESVPAEYASLTDQCGGDIAFIMTFAQRFAFRSLELAGPAALGEHGRALLRVIEDVLGPIVEAVGARPKGRA